MEQIILQELLVPMQYRIHEHGFVGFFPQTFTVAMKFNVKFCQDKLEG